MIDRINRGLRATDGRYGTVYASSRYIPSDPYPATSGLLFKRGRRPRLSDLRASKLTLLFNCFDNDRDGRIEIGDFEMLTRCIADAYHLESGMIKHALMYAETMTFWNVIKTTTDLNGDGVILLDEFLLTYDDMTRREETFARVRRGFATFLLRIGDRDRDDMLDEHEYSALLSCLGVGAATARSAFRRLLPPGAALLSSASLERATGEFLRDDDPDAPGNWLLGALP